MVVSQTEVIVRNGEEVVCRHLVPPGVYVIGRDGSAEIHVEGIDLVSRQHARLIVQLNEILIEDLGSANGTFVNGKPITGTTKLWPGQKVRIGDAVIELRRVKSPTDSDQSLAPQSAQVRKLLPEEIRGQKKYDIGGVVARGGMGAILDAQEVPIRRKVAMKVMLGDGNADDISRFVEEGQITGQLEHPNIVPVYELGVNEQDQPFYTMKFVRGISLQKVLDLIADGVPEVARKYPLNALLTILQKVCDGIAFAHSKSVIHRDLKPENIMLGEYGEALVMDWGLAKLLGAERHGHEPGHSVHAVQSIRQVEGSAGSTMVGSIMGTPHFMPPEQANGEVDKLDARSDIYSLGAILYQILTLQCPVDGEDLINVLENVRDGLITPPLKRVGSKRLAHLPSGRVPESLSAVAMKALAWSQKDRYASVRELQDELASYQNGFATAAENAGSWKQLKLFVARNRTLSAASAVIVLLIGLFSLKLLADRGRILAERNRATAALASLRRAAPTLIAEARKSIDEQNFDEAMSKIRFALEIDPENAEYRLLSGQLLEARLDLPSAVGEFRRVLAHGANSSATANLDLCERLAHRYASKEALDQAAVQEIYMQLVSEGRATQAAPLAVKLGQNRKAFEAILEARLKGWRRLPGWDKLSEATRVRWQPGEVLALDFSGMALNEIPEFSGLPITQLRFTASQTHDLSPLRGLPLKKLDIQGFSQLTDLSPLEGMPLDDFSATMAGQLEDLTPLRGAPLRKVSIWGSRVRDLSPLNNAHLRELHIRDTPVLDLNGLRGAPLVELNAYNSALQDISSVSTMKLRVAQLAGCRKIRDWKPLLECPELEILNVPDYSEAIGVLRSHSTLRLIGTGYEPASQPAAAFWAAFDAERSKGKK